MNIEFLNAKNSLQDKEICALLAPSVFEPTPEFLSAFCRAKLIYIKTAYRLTNRRQKVIIANENGRRAKEDATALFCLFVCKAARGL